MDHIGEKKINSCSALDQKEINLARTFHHSGGTASRLESPGI